MAQAFPTNLTVLVEGGQQLYATRGHDKCAVETLQRTPLAGSKGKLDRVKVRGYCIDPASDIPGTARLLVPTFSFTAPAQKWRRPVMRLFFCLLALGCGDAACVRRPARCPAPRSSPHS